MLSSPPIDIANPLAGLGRPVAAPVMARSDLNPAAPAADGTRAVPAVDDARTRVSIKPPDAMETVEFVRMLNSIQEATAHKPGTVIQFVSSAADSSSVRTAYNAAWIGSALLGKRVLFIDAAQSGAKQTIAVRTSKRLADVAQGRADLDEAMVRQADTSLYIATLQQERIAGDSIILAQQFKMLLESIRGSFDLIVIAPPPALEHPLAAMLTAFVSGSVLVLPAGRAGNHAAQRTLRLLSSGGSPILGAVLSERRNYIPRWLRRWL